MRIPPGAVLFAALVTACTDGAMGSDPPSFPADYAASYKEVRGCRQSSEHDLNRIRVLADPSALGPYQKRDQPFPVGAIVLKEEYDTSDPTCTGPIKRWTVMKRLATGSASSTLDWRWEDVDKDRNVTSTDSQRCIGCHKGCAPPSGFDSTCIEP